MMEKQFICPNKKCKTHLWTTVVAIKYLELKCLTKHYIGLQCRVCGIIQIIDIPFTRTVYGCGKCDKSFKSLTGLHEHQKICKVI